MQIFLLEGVDVCEHMAYKMLKKSYLQVQALPIIGPKPINFLLTIYKPFL